MVELMPGIRDTLSTWRDAELTFLAEMAERMDTWYYRLGLGQNDQFKHDMGELRDHINKLPVKGEYDGFLIGKCWIPFDWHLTAGGFCQPIRELLNYWNFSKNFYDNQLLFNALFVQPPSEAPTWLLSYLDEANQDFFIMSPQAEYEVRDYQLSWLQELYNIELSALSHALMDRIYYKPSTVSTKCRLIKWWRGQRWANIDPIWQAYEKWLQSRDDQKAVSPVSRIGMTYYKYQYRHWTVAPYFTRAELMMYAEKKLGVEMWNKLDQAQRRPFWCLAYGRYAVDYRRSPLQRPTQDAQQLANTLNKAYLMFLHEYYLYWQAQCKRLAR